MSNDKFHDQKIDRTWLQIDPGAARHNVTVVRRHATASRIMAVVKANAYGHGAETIAAAIAAQVDAFAVATVAEGIALRQVQIELPIVVLSAFHSAAQINSLCHYQLTPVIHTAAQLAWLEDSELKPTSVWIKLNTGMNRLGFAADQVASAVARIEAIAGLQIAGLMSHLANADDLDDTITEQQINRFNALTADYAYPRSLANSAGVLAWPDTHLDWVRPGIMLYGASPILNKTAVELGLQAVMQLESKLIAVRTVAAGAAVGYGASWRCRNECRVGIVGIGYGDGYPRIVDDQTVAVIADQRCPVIGRVSMDSLALDLSGCTQATVGQRVILWGKSLPVEEVADCAATISYELLCRVTPRVSREIVADDNE